MAKNKIKIYIKPTCTTCRKTLKILKEKETEYDSVNYYEVPLSKSRLKALLKKLGMAPRDILRKKEQVYRDLEIANTDYSDAELIDLMVKHPDLIERPIVEMGDNAVLARPAEEIEKFLK